MSTRLQLRRRSDDKVFLDRWGWECRLFGVFVHRMDAPDPGLDLHDHPWWFASLILKGGYEEWRSEVRRPNVRAGRQRPRLKTMRLDECHTIFKLTRTPTWTIVLHGPKRRMWGFYADRQWVPWKIYEQTVRAERRDVYVPISNVEEERLA